MTGQRNLNREAQFLAYAAGLDDDAFVRHATDRLRSGQRLYGDRWTVLGPRQLLLELMEEAADLGAWGALLIQAVDSEESLSSADRERLRSAARCSARHGAQTHRVLERALQALHDGTEAAA